MIKKLSEAQKAWLAGFIDGEGYVGIVFQTKKETRKSSATPRYHPFIVIANNDLEVLRYIQKIIGEGRVNLVRDVRGNCNRTYQYRLSKSVALLHTLECLFPYLKIKNRQCDILTKFLQRRALIKPITGRGHRGTTSFNEVDYSLYKRLAALNKRGVV